MLNQPYYPAPTVTEGEPTGPLRLGHLLPGPRSTGNIINRSRIERFHDDMNPWNYPINNFKFSIQPERTSDSSVGLNVPLAEAAGTLVKADTGAFFRHATGTSWNIEQLAVSFVDPTDSYKNDVAESNEVKEWVRANQSVLGAWELYVITGLMIARGAQSESTRSTELGPHATLRV